MSADSAPRVRRWLVAAALVLGFLLILVTRLTPFQFVSDGHIPFERFTWEPLNFRDVPLNLLLFIPFGFGLAGMLRRAGRSRRTTAALTVGAGLLLSAALESAQMFLPSRVPSLADIAANTASAWLGYALYRAWEMGFAVAVRRYVTPRAVLAALAVYALGVALFTVYLQQSVRLSNWNTSFPLVVGNEAVGKRQWSGRVADLTFAVGGAEGAPFAAYDFAGKAPYPDTVGASPALQWMEGPTSDQSQAAGVTVGPGEWLATREAFAAFSATARESDAFTIAATVATADPGQWGPARIVSVSADAERRNVTIGQEREALIVRLRTPAGGENGQKPEVLLPGVFSEVGPHAVTVHYDAPRLEVSVNGDVRALSLAPGAAFFGDWVTANRWAVALDGNPRRYDYWYWLVMAAPALGLAFAAAVARRLATRGAG